MQQRGVDRSFSENVENRADSENAGSNFAAADDDCR